MVHLTQKLKNSPKSHKVAIQTFYFQAKNILYNISDIFSQKHIALFLSDEFAAHFHLINFRFSLLSCTQTKSCYPSIYVTQMRDKRELMEKEHREGVTTLHLWRTDSHGCLKAHDISVGPYILHCGCQPKVTRKALFQCGHPVSLGLAIHNNTLPLNWLSSEADEIWLLQTHPAWSTGRWHTNQPGRMNTVTLLINTLGQQRLLESLKSACHGYTKFLTTLLAQTIT